MLKVFTCSQCGKEKTNNSEFTTGYGLDKNDNKICFDCCGINDRNELLNLKFGEKICLYLVEKENKIINFPGTLNIKVGYIKKGLHNIAGTRSDTWFSLEGLNFHAVLYGSFTEICHIKRVK